MEADVATRYTQVERPTMWLVPEGDLDSGGRCIEVDPFYLSRTVLTNLEFEEFDPGHERTSLTAEDEDPVVSVTWSEAEEYCRWYAELSHKPFRLPTEVEWAHACRCERPGRFFWGDDEARADAFVLDADNFADQLTLQSRRPNPFGLYDMLGTVWEWTAERSTCGGSFLTPRAELSWDVRGDRSFDRAHPDVGFRIVRSLRI